MVAPSRHEVNFVGALGGPVHVPGNDKLMAFEGSLTPLALAATRLSV